jgi:UDPglucose 6-dehydrogenase
MTKVAFINEIENLSTKIGANIKDLTKAMGLDHRIGSAFLNPGPGIGGSCFPKDSMALNHIAKNHEVKLAILEQVIATNIQRFKDSAQKIQDFCKKNNSKKIAILGLAFKAGTDDVRMSPAIEIIKHLLANNLEIFAYDPHAIENSKKILSDKINYCDSLEECFNSADQVAILTEWPEFKNIKNFANFNAKNILDLRYIL